MFSLRNAVARGAPRQCLKSSSLLPLRHARTFASPASTLPTYEVSEANGVKVVSKDTGSPTASLAVVIRAGSRYQPLPGLAHALEHFAFKATSKRSSLFITREVELMGGILETSLSRENIVYKARFLRGDLPYFVELLGDAMTKPVFNAHEFKEQVIPTMEHESHVAYSNPSYFALEAAHAVAYHQGLGLDQLSYVRKDFATREIALYASLTFNKSNFAVVGSGVPHSDLVKYTTEFFGGAKTGEAADAESSAYYGGENRVWSRAGNAVVIAFPGSAGGAAFKPELSVLSYLLGGQSNIKWSHGSSLVGKVLDKYRTVTAASKNITYSDTGLFYVTVAGQAEELKNALPGVVEAIKSLKNVKAEDVKRAIQNAKFDVYAAAEDNALSLEAIGQSVIATGGIPQIEQTIKAIEGVTLDSVKKAATALLANKAAVGVVGDLHILPYACDLGLTV
ncbi:ubiquinol-cytochrome c reductase core subunit 1 [Orbilia brochopaga]|uniref:Cytochrome b-c1 complex subunit 2, mitochondrial n=1 Tax=Orbilia brochopaga TaxID=3140254 RepID=A0AAV9UIL8_9PEZI